MQTLTISGASVTLRGEGQRTSILLWRGLPNSRKWSQRSSRRDARAQYADDARSLAAARRRHRRHGARWHRGRIWAPWRPITYSDRRRRHHRDRGYSHRRGPLAEWERVLGPTASCCGTPSARKDRDVQHPGCWRCGMAGHHVSGMPHASGTRGDAPWGSPVHDGTITSYCQRLSWCTTGSEVVNVQQVVIKRCDHRHRAVQGAGRGTSVDQQPDLDEGLRGPELQLARRGRDHRQSDLPRDGYALRRHRDQQRQRADGALPHRSATTSGRPPAPAPGTPVS